MGMQFTIDITGDVTFEGIDASDLGIDADAAIENEVGYTAVQFEDVNVVGGSVTIEASARIEGVEVPVVDLADYDAEEALNEFIGSYNSDVRNAQFEVTDSPTGFDVVSGVTDRDTAIAVYAALEAAGLEVTE